MGERGEERRGYAFFQILGTVALRRELLKRLVNGAAITSASSLSILLFSKSGPEAFPVTSDFKIDLTSSSSTTTQLKVCSGCARFGIGLLESFSKV